MSKETKTEIEIKGTECRNCGSKKTIAHTDKDLRRDHLLVWQCFDCNGFFQTGWDIDMPPRQDVIEHCIKYKEQIENYMKKNEN